MEEKSRREHIGADVGYISKGGRGHFRGRERGDGSGRGFIRGRGRGDGLGRGHFRGQGRGDGSGRGRIYNNWRGRGRGRGGEIIAGGGNWGHSHKDCGQQYRSGEITPLEIPEEIYPLELFVGNLRQNVNSDQLLATLRPHANVLSAIIVKKIYNEGLNYGFVTLQAESDVKKIMDLNNKNCILSGSKLIFRPARKRSVPSRGEVLVQETSPDRDYDLSPIDPNKPSIHVLVDDVLIQILEFLPLKKSILCEVVCRRWQALLYVMFKSTTHLNLCDDYLIQNSLIVTKPMLSKILLLKGKMLNSLSVSDVNYTVSNIFFTIISQYCPNLECLELAEDTLVYTEDIKALKGCKHLKTFYANKWSFLDENSFKELISVLPGLEKLDVSQTDIKGNCFHLLPKSLKELNINHCTQVSKKNLRKLIKACKHLEMLEIEELDIDADFLKELALNSTKLRSLRLFIKKPVDFSNQVKLFTKLTSLQIYAHQFELNNIADDLKDLEILHIALMTEPKHMVDFGKFPCLKKVDIFDNCFSNQELISLEKCKSMKSVSIQSGDDAIEADKETIKRIVKGCPVIEHIRCPEIDIDKKFLDNIQEIMKKRSEPLKMSIYVGGFLIIEDYIKAKYDKILLDFLEHSECDEDSDDDSYDDFDDYDSDDDQGFDSSDMENFMFGHGYDSDDY